MSVHREPDVEARLKMVQKSLARSIGIGAWHFARANLSRQGREEFNLDQIADDGIGVGAQRALRCWAQCFWALVRHQKAGVDVHQNRLSRRARMTTWLMGCPVTRSDARKARWAGSRRRVRFGGISRAISRPRRMRDTSWPDETSSRSILNRRRASATLTAFIG